MSAIGEARDARQRAVGYAFISAIPEINDMDPRSVRVWMSGRDVCIDNTSAMPFLANALDHRAFVSVFWQVISEGMINVCQPFAMLFLAYIDFCDVCGRTSRLSRRNFVGLLADVARKDWVCPVDSDGSLSRVNPNMWVLGRETYVESLLLRAKERFGDDPTSAESITAWLPPYADRKRIAKGGALYLRCVYDWCHAMRTTPRQTIESRWGIDVAEPDLAAAKPWERARLSEQYWLDYQQALSDAQERLVRLCRREWSRVRPDES